MWRIDHLVEDGDEIQLGNTTLRFISTPGHTPGQGCYYDEQDIFVGDTLFMAVSAVRICQWEIRL